MADALKLLAIFPHPDDETLGLGSTLARYSSEGVETYLVCATRGERGWFDSEGPNSGLEGVAQIREAELSCAAEHLGLRQVSYLDTIDGDVDQANPDEMIRKLVRHIRHIQPHVVVTFSPDGNYGHPDHIALSQLTMGALVCAADETYKDARGRSPHRVSKFYYMVDSVDIVRISVEAFGGISMDVDGVTRHHVGWETWQITTRLDNSRYMDVVQKAIQCHKSQLPGYGPISEWSLEELAKVFGVGNFYRAYSLVNGGRNVETDLFDGLR
ncbi:MAG TPA: PIG-L deacetylase family protein [Anaerolineales bacterium]|nr:PIG-L deacetylase family protein [Anaerolineales bacterium]